jgi:hypothetical protein
MDKNSKSWIRLKVTIMKVGAIFFLLAALDQISFFVAEKERKGEKRRHDDRESERDRDRRR